MRLRGFCDDVARSVAFLSRLPVPSMFFDGHDGRMSRMIRAFPLAGMLIALPAAVLLALLMLLDADPLMAAFIVLAVQTLIGGALHEDGLGDTADGLGGGRDRDHALSIMKDSSIGSYGAIAMILSVGMRAAAIAAIARLATPTAAAAALMGVAAISRTAMVWHWSSTPPARADGVAASVGQPESGSARIAYASGLLFAAILLIAAASVPALLLAVLLAGALVAAFTARVRRRIGGHTGDTIGATQQIAEIAGLCALALAS